MAASIALEKCIRCGICMDECPTGAICYKENNVPVVIEQDCTECGICIPLCGTEAITV